MSADHVHPFMITVYPWLLSAGKCTVSQSLVRLKLVPPFGGTTEQKRTGSTTLLKVEEAFPHDFDV